MVKNQIQEDRMKSYFITSAKEIIRGEGMRALSVRTVAEKAGYSYATLYNYFKDLRELVFYCIVDFLDELREFVDEPTKGEESILKRSKAFCNYFVQYPGTFSVIFSEQMTEIVHNVEIMEEINKTFLTVFGEYYNSLATQNNQNESDIFERHKFLIIGILTMYLLRREPKSYEEFQKKLETIIQSF